MTVKTDVSRFHVHDELTAPEGSDRMLKTIAETGGSISKFVGVLAGAPRALRVFARMRSELRAGSVPEATQVRIALAVAEHRGDGYSVAQHARTARQLGLGLDEISRARSFDSSDEREASPAAAARGKRRQPTGTRPSTCSRRHARSTGPTSRSSRRSPWLP